MENPSLLRAHSIVITAGADTLDDLITSLEQIIFDLRRGSTQCTSGSPSAGYIFEYKHDPTMTHDRYFELLNQMLQENYATSN